MQMYRRSAPSLYIPAPFHPSHFPLVGGILNANGYHILKTMFLYSNCHFGIAGAVVGFRIPSIIR